ncbi:MAG: ATP synthase F1 subunit gamma [Deltaproteobacteria bacterium]|nr:ATP synthase F1 subunit gamma [Deltaproteobacteria bacterium]
MATLKDVQTKIGSVKKTRQITKAMNMVATSRLRGAQQAMEAFRPYALKFSEVLGSLSENAGEDASPLLVPREIVKKVHVVLCTSDRGLCGGFNANLTTAAKKFIRDKGLNSLDVSFTNFGKKGRDWCKNNGYTIAQAHLGVVGGKIGFTVAARTGQSLVDGFLNGDFDEVYLVFSEFVSVAKQLPVIKQILPIPPIELPETDEPEDTEYLAEHLCEPSADELLSEILPRSVYVQLFRGLLETSTSEHAARMMAMDNATSACNDMIENLELAYNKARQAAITADLMDIVGGAEALKG